MNSGEPESEPAFHHTLRVLRRRWPWLLACLVIATAAAYGISKTSKPKYTASASVQFNISETANAIAGLPGSGTGGTSQSIQDTNVLLLRLGPARETAIAIGHGLTPADVAGSIHVSPVGDTQVVAVQVTSRSPALAAKIANTYSSIFVAEQGSAYRASFLTALNAVNKQLAKLNSAEKASALGLSLQDKASTLSTLAELPSGAVQLLSRATAPRSPSSPHTKTNVILGVFFGLLLGLAAVFLLERLDQRIREPKDLERIYGLPLLGVVPESTALARADRDRGATIALPPRDAEVFHLIRAHLRYFEVDRDLQTLLVASAASRDGKTTIARSLAMAAAQAGSRVLLLEADLRRPTLAGPLGLAPGPGLADVLIGAVPLSEATQLVDLDGPGGDLTLGRPLAVLVAGQHPPPNPGELLESLAMERVLEQSRVAYDLVVVDTAPLALVSDSFSLLNKVDGVMIVGRLGRTRRDVAQRLRQTLAGGGGPVLGVIANGYKSRRRSPYGYAINYEGSDSVGTPTLR